MAVWVTGAKMKRTGQDDRQSVLGEGVEGTVVIISCSLSVRMLNLQLPEKMAFTDSWQQFSVSSGAKKELEKKGLNIIFFYAYTASHSLTTQ